MTCGDHHEPMIAAANGAFLLCPVPGCSRWWPAPIDLAPAMPRLRRRLGYSPAHQREQRIRRNRIRQRELERLLRQELAIVTRQPELLAAATFRPKR